jgi:hypothetical protein
MLASTVRILRGAVSRVNGAMAETFIIRDEGDIWRLLEAMLDGSKGAPDILQIVGWRPRLLYFPDDAIGHSISPSLARAVSGFHASLSRSYAYMVYGKANAGVLHSDDKAALDIKMLVVSGSNGIEVLGDALDRLTHAIIHKLTSRQMAVLLAIFLLLHFGATVTKEWIAAQYAEKAHADDEKTQVALSEEETRRMNLLIEALEKNPGIKPVASFAEEGRVPLVRSVIPHSRGSVLGTEISGEQASVIISKEKEQGESRRLDGRFEVVEIDVENPEGWMGTLKNPKTQQEIRVSLNRMELTGEDLQALFGALKDKSSVDALVNAWFVGGKIAYAAVMRANPIGKP